MAPRAHLFRKDVRLFSSGSLPLLAPRHRHGGSHRRRGVATWRSQTGDRLESGCRLGLATVVAATPLALGGQDPWAVAGVPAALLVLTGAWLVARALKGAVQLRWTPAAGLALVLCAAGGLQLLQAERLVGWLSPASLERWQAARDAGATDWTACVSLSPTQTHGVLVVLATAALFVFLAGQLFATRRHLVWLSLTVVAAALVSAGVAMVPAITGSQPFHASEYGGDACRGGFANRNHFAALMGLGLLNTAGLGLAAWFSHRRRHLDEDPLRRWFEQHWQGVVTALAAGALLLGCAQLLSLSRGGVGATILAVAVLAVLALRADRLRLVTGAAGICLVVLVLWAGATGVIGVKKRYQALVDGRELSLGGRLTVWHETLPLLRDHWRGGIGLGAFAQASPRYESEWGGDRITNHAHNDYLEILVELGVPLGLLVLGVVLGGIGLALWRLRRQHDPVLRWLGYGAGTALLALLVHETVDYSLRSPGVLYAALSSWTVLVLAGQLSAKHPTPADAPEDGWRLGRFPSPGSVVLVLLGLAFIGAALALAPRHLAAGLAKSRVRDLIAAEPARQPLSRVAQAEFLIRQAERVLSRWPDDPLARKVRGVCGSQLAFAAPDDPQARPAPDRETTRRAAEQTVADMTRACRPFPTHGLYQASLARLLEQLGDLDGRTDETRVAALYRLAHANRPSVGQVSWLCARGAWTAHERSGRRDPARAAEALALFRECLEETPDRAANVFASLWQDERDVPLLLQVVPTSLIACDQLYTFLADRGLYAACRDVLTALHDLNASRPTLDDPKDLRPDEYWRIDRRSRAEVELVTRERRLFVLAMLGDWDGRSREEADLAAWQASTVRQALAEVETWYRAGQLHRAQLRLAALHEAAPLAEEAMLLHAQVLIELGNPVRARRALLPLVYRADHTFPAETLRRAQALAESVRRVPLEDRGDAAPIGPFVARALEIRVAAATGTTAGLAAAAEELAALDTPTPFGPPLRWIQRPLLAFYEGWAWELAGKPFRALQAYERALALCPRHAYTLAAIERLTAGGGLDESRLSPNARTALAADREACADLVPVALDFPQGVRLLGYAHAPDRATREQALHLRLVWLCTDDIVRAHQVLCAYRRQSQTAFAERIAPAADELDMVAWRVGERVIVERELRPAQAAARHRTFLAPGQYDVTVELAEVGGGARPTAAWRHTSAPLANGPAFAILP